MTTMGSVGVLMTLLMTTGLMTARLTSAASPNCLAADNNCGSITGISPSDPYLYIYKFSEQEKSGTCSRNGVTYVNTDETIVPSNTLGICRCKNAECEACLSGKEKALQSLADDCCGVIYNYTYNGATYYTIVPKRPECCFALDTDDAGKVTHTCYCPSTTTACFLACPAPPTSATSPLARIIFSRPVVTDACARNLAVIRVFGFVICHAPLAYHPEGTDSAGNKLTKPVYLLTNTCSNAIDKYASKNINMKVTIGTTTFDYKVAEVTKTRLVNNNIVALTFNTYTGPCTNSPDCTYNKAMGDLDPANCYFLSFGDNKPGSSLVRADVFKAKDYDKDSLNNTVKSFFVKDSITYTNGTDLGAPLYCPLNRTGEYMLYGLFATLGTVGNKTKLFPVLTI